MTHIYTGPLKGNPKFHCENVTDGFYFDFGSKTQKDPRSFIGVAMIDDDERGMEIAKVDENQISYLIPHKPNVPKAVMLNYALSLVRFCDYCVVGFGPLSEADRDSVQRFIDLGEAWATITPPKYDDPAIFFFTADEIRKLGGFDPNDPLENVWKRNRYYDPNLVTAEGLRAVAI